MELEPGAVIVKSPNEVVEPPTENPGGGIEVDNKPVRSGVTRATSSADMC